ncbi:MAG: YebG family protein [Halioglobus sp.]|nr:YebG family protein [Halioglobus sp.]
MWKCDRDDAMFDSKKNADAHDKMLELAENFSALFEKHIESISEQDAEMIGLLLSKNKNILVAACKGQPELLADIGSEAEEASNITPLTAKA